MKCAVIGVGNPILKDDSLGIRAVHLAEHLLESKGLCIDNVGFLEASTGGLSLAERFLGHESVIVVDAITTGNHVPGTVLEVGLDELQRTIVPATPHDINLPTAWKVISDVAVPTDLPSQIKFILVEIEAAYDFGEKLSPLGREVLPSLVSKIVARLVEWKYLPSNLLVVQENETISIEC